MYKMRRIGLIPAYDTYVRYISVRVDRYVELSTSGSSPYDTVSEMGPAIRPHEGAAT